MKGVVITGASRGLGSALLCRLTGSPARLIAIGRGALPKGVAAGADIRTLDLDFRHLSDPEHWIRLATELSVGLAASPPLDGIVFINNAGTVQPIGGPDETDPASISDGILVNFTAPLAILRALIAFARSGGIPLHVVNITSGASVRPIGGWTVYCATKAGIRMGLDAAQRTYPDMMTVVHVDPGALDGSMQEEIRSSGATFPDRDLFVRWKSEGRLRSVEEAANDIYTNHIQGRL